MFYILTAIVYVLFCTMLGLYLSERDHNKNLCEEIYILKLDRSNLRGLNELLEKRIKDLEFELNQEGGN